jgi:phosphate transport system substrate-binding protein
MPAQTDYARRATGADLGMEIEMARSVLGLRHSLMTVATLAALGLAPATALSGEIALRSPDGAIDFEGEFLEFDDGYYVVRTALGDLRVSTARVDCEGAACPHVKPADADIRFAGSNAFGFGMMPALLQGYAAFLDSDASVVKNDTKTDTLADFVAVGGFGDEIGTYLVSSTVSGDAFDALLNRTAHFGMSSRRINPSEARALRDVGAGNMTSPDQEHIIAIDSLVVITHPENPVREITMTQLSDVFAGRVTNWRDLGGADMPIGVINRQAESGTRSVFYNAIFGDAPPDVRLANEVIANDNKNAVRLVTEDPAAISFVGYAFQNGAKPLTLINACGMPTEPDAFSAKIEEYALQRRLYFYNRAEALPQSARDFLDYAVSEDADSVIAKSGFIDLGITRKTQDLNGPRARMLLDPKVDRYEGSVMRDMLAEMSKYDRLSVNFRFRTGSWKLDERGSLDMKRLVNYLAGMPEGTKIMFAGFTDNVGAFKANRGLSLARARMAIKDLQRYAGDRLSGITFAAVGFGEIAPSTCNITETGRAVNRRVEVWIEAGHQS